MQAVVLAGGRGSRLAASGQPPKPLVPIAGLAILDHILGQLAANGVSDVVVLTAWRAAEIAAALGNGQRHGLQLHCLAESEPLGTAGAVYAARALLAERFFVVYGDLLFDLSLGDLWQAHLRSGAVATLTVHPNDHPLDSDRVIVDRFGNVRQIVSAAAGAGPDAGALCNAALYVLERRVLDGFDDAEWASRPRDFARDLFPRLLGRGDPLFAWRTAEYVKDMGTEARLARVDADLRTGVPLRLRRGAPKPALLCDRDGVLIEDRPYVTRASELTLLPGVAHALQRLNRGRVLSAVCTNQPVVARGALDEDGLFALHGHLEGLLGQAGAWLDGIFACPHHPDRGYAGERAELKLACSCRKPMPGLIHAAQAALGIDLRRSIFVGDRTADLLCARRAGLLGVGVLSGTALLDGSHPIPTETPIVGSLSEAVAILLDTAPSWRPWLSRIREAGIVMLGGPSRAGKTVAAAALRLALGTEGVDVLHVSLDRFIQAATERRPDAPLKERIGFGAAEEAMRTLVAGDAVLLPGYDPCTRTRTPSEVMVRAPSQVLIIEGLLAGALALPGALSLALVTPRAVRDERRAAFYRWKGLTGEMLSRATNGPSVDAEEAEVDEASLRAHLALTLDPSLRLVEFR